MGLVNVSPEEGGGARINFSGAIDWAKGKIEGKNIPYDSSRLRAVALAVTSTVAAVLIVENALKTPEANASEQGMRQNMWLPISMLENFPIGDGRSIQVTGATFFRQQPDGGLVKVHG